MRRRNKIQIKINTAPSVKKTNQVEGLQIRNIGKSGLTKEFVKKIVDKTIFFANFEGSAAYSIIFLDVKEMKVIDRGYKPRPHHISNVLTFNLYDDPVVADIFVCVPQARKEAKAYRLSASSYVSFLIIHGILHSMGFAHEQGARKRKVMEALEEKILFSLFPKLSS